MWTPVGGGWWSKTSKSGFPDDALFSFYYMFGHKPLRTFLRYTTQGVANFLCGLNQRLSGGWWSKTSKWGGVNDLHLGGHKNTRMKKQKG